MVTRDHIVRWLEATAVVMRDNKEYLTQLDAAIGDADHGINMARGFNKVAEKLPSVADKDIGNILKTIGMTLISSVGGASGPLYGTFFMRSGMTLAAKEELDDDDLFKMLKSGVEGIVQRGRPQLEDKTMFDAWSPALEAMESALQNGQDTRGALTAAVAAAEQGMKNTIPLQARKGRASYLGERSIGHQDPGATSSYLMLKALLDTLEN
jgi:phosphoenolpyruvate---glycerone phosphotransferase subunit DhaL